MGKPKMYVAVGIVASGKSTYAEEMKENDNNLVIVSSDSIREEILGDVNDQTKNNEVFEEVYKRVNKALNDGNDVYLDATNINRKRRIHILSQEIKVDCEKIALYFPSTISQSVVYNMNRERKVPTDVIRKMFKTLHVPTVREGFDEVRFIKNSVRDMDNKIFDKSYDNDYDFSKVIDDYSTFWYFAIQKFQHLGHIYELPHDSTYHSFSVSRHTYHVCKYIHDYYKGDRMEEMMLAGLFHDSGKAMCKTFINHKGETTRYASFLQHENVSTQLAIDELLYRGYDEEKLKFIVDLVQFHMMAHDESVKVAKRLRNLLTEEQLDHLSFLHIADTHSK